MTARVIWALVPLLIMTGVAGAATLEERLAAVAERGETVLRFEERRQAGLFRREVRFTGRLEYDRASGMLIKAVEAPEPSRLTISDTHFEYTDARKTRRLALARRPELAALMLSVRAILTGNTSDLDAAFISVYSETEEDGWAFSLRPRDAALADRLSELTLRGVEDEVLSIDVTLADGKQQRMLILSDAP